MIFLLSRGLSKSLLQNHNSKASVLQHSVFFMVQLSHPYMTAGKTTALTVWTFVSKVISLLFNMLSRFLFPFHCHGSNSIINQATLHSILKSRDITLLTKVHTVKAVVFPAVMYGCESWTTKKAKYQRTDAFKLWCRRRLLSVPWRLRRSN